MPSVKQHQGGGLKQNTSQNSNAKVNRSVFIIDLNGRSFPRETTGGDYTLVQGDAEGFPRDETQE